MPINVDEAWRVCATERFELPLSAIRVWGQMRNLREFLTIDPLHARVHFEPRGLFVPPVGTPLVIEHRLFGFGPDRVGRVLCFREGCGFAVSDLSRRGVRVGFPHVCEYRVEPIAGQRCRVIVSARGRWTARVVPRWLVRCWLWWVMAGTRRRITAYFLAIPRRRH